MFTLCMYIIYDSIEIFFSQVILCYKEEGFDFLLKVFNTPNYLEDLTGLSKLFSETIDDQVHILNSQYHCSCGGFVFQVWELSDDEN